MDENHIKRISFMVTIIGLISLFFYTDGLNLDVANQIEDIPNQEEVKFSGEIIKLNQANRTIFLKIRGERTEIIDVVLFNNEDIYLNEGNFVEIMGNVEEYRGKKELIAHKIELKND